MDFTNTYGVHPFWPLDNHWYYGDFIFIAEPAIWVAMTPLVFVLVSRIARTAVALLLLAGVAVAGLVGVVAWQLVVVLLIAMALLAFVSRKVSQRTALFLSVAVWLSVTVVFAIAGRVAQHRMYAAMARAAPESRVLDTILTPAPANPLCWEAIVVSRTEKSYALRSAQLSLAPSWLPPEKCRRTSPVDGITAPLEKVAGPPAPGIAWHGEYIASIADLKTFVDSYCQVAAMMRFVRAPFFVEHGFVRNGPAIVGDLRYDRESNLGFAELSLEDLPEHCSLHIPPWVPPRKDLEGI
jgi:inner membrane protein